MAYDHRAKIGEAGGEKLNHSKAGPPAPIAGAPGTCDGVRGVRGSSKSEPKADERITCGDGGALEAADGGPSEPVTILSDPARRSSVGVAAGLLGEPIRYGAK